MGREQYKQKQIKGVRKPLHRVIVEKHLKRELKITEIIHHINQDKHNNNLSNLKIMTIEEHSSLHGGKKKKYPKNCKRNRLLEGEIRKIVKMNKSGLNYSEIGRILGISNQRARNYALKYK